MAITFSQFVSNWYMLAGHKEKSNVLSIATYPKVEYKQKGETIMPESWGNYIIYAR